MKFISLFKTDVKAVYGIANFKSYLKAIINPSLHACFLLRLGTTYDSKILHIFMRNILIFKHSIDIGVGCKLGAGMILPHPMGIVFGDKVSFGNGCKIYHNCTFGKKNGGYPNVGNNCVFFPGSIIVGPIVVGESSVVGANVFLDHDLSHNSTYLGQGRTKNES